MVVKQGLHSSPVLIEPPLLHFSLLASFDCLYSTATFAVPVDFHSFPLNAGLESRCWERT